MIWRLIDSGPCSPFWNMALDEAILELFPQVKIPTLRLYRWSIPTLSIGYSQSADQIDLEECKRSGVAFVRRPTGGRAVFHDQELTYSLIHPLTGMGSVNESHRRINQALALGLRQLGLPAELEMRMKRSFRSPRSFSPACFDTPSYSELTVNGKKVIGSAQTRRRQAILEHGSIPLELDLEKLLPLLKFEGISKERAKETLCKRAGSLNQFSRKNLSIEEVKRAVRKGFAGRFGAELREAELAKEEKLTAERLVKERYSKSDWNFKS